MPKNADGNRRNFTPLEKHNLCAFLLENQEKIKNGQTNKQTAEDVEKILGFSVSASYAGGLLRELEIISTPNTKKQFDLLTKELANLYYHLGLTPVSSNIQNLLAARKIESGDPK